VSTTNQLSSPATDRYLEKGEPARASDGSTKSVYQIARPYSTVPKRSKINLAGELSGLGLEDPYADSVLVAVVQALRRSDPVSRRR